MRRIAQTNGREFPTHIFENLTEKVENCPNKEIEIEPNSSGVSFITMLHTSQILLRRIFNMSFQWFSVTLCYYGLSFASTSLSENVFTDFMLSVAIEIPGYIFCLLTINRCGRRPILSLCQIISGLACIACAFLFQTNQPIMMTIKLILSLIGKFGASAAFAIVYLYTAEVFPTCTR